MTAPDGRVRHRISSVGRRSRDDGIAAILSPLGHQGAYSWPVAAASLAVSTAKQLLSDAPAIGGPFGGWVVASALSALAFLVVFTGVGRLLRRTPEIGRAHV